MSELDKKAGLDLLTVLLVLVVVKQTLIPHTFLFAGPASTLSAMIVATLLLRRRNLTWWDLGLRMPSGWGKTLLYTALAFLTIIVFGKLASSIAGLFFEDVGASGRFDQVEGNLLIYLGMLVLVWVHSAFFEEMLFRAFIIHHASDFMGENKFSLMTAVIFAAVFFGYRHYYYQGIKGAITTGVIGLGLGLLYIWFGRKNLLPLILAHGLVNTIGQTQRFLGGPD